MKCIQANLHHAKAATAELRRRFAGASTNIGLIQEPWIHIGRIAGLKIPNTQVIYDMGAVLLGTLAYSPLAFLNIYI